MANYGLNILVDAPYLLEEGVDVDDFPVLVKIPLANAANLFGAGETGDTVYFASGGEVLKHECVAIDADYAYFWVKCDLETITKKLITLHYGALVDNNYEDKRGVWVNGVNIYHFHGNANDTMGLANGTPVDANVLFGTAYGVNYQGVYIPSGKSISFSAMTVGTPNTMLVWGTNLGGTRATWLGNTTISTYSGYCTGTYNGNYTFTYQPTTSSLSYAAANSVAVGANLTNNIPHQYTAVKYAAGSNLFFVYDTEIITTITYYATVVDSFAYTHIGVGEKSDVAANTTGQTMQELWVFSDAKSQYWIQAMYRMYNNLSVYVEIGTEVDLDSLTDITDEKVCCIANIVRQLEIYDYDFKKMVYEVGDKNAYWRPPGSEGVYVWGKLEMRPLYGEDVSFVDNLYANDAYFYTFTDYTYDIHDKLIVEGVIYDIQAIQVHDAGSETIYKTLVLKRQPEYYACCVGIVS